jgi:regulator of replication initiation timing
MQAELARVTSAYVADALEYREVKSALQARLKQLEAELNTAKCLIKDQDYQLQNSSGTEGVATSVVADNIALERDNTALRKRMREYEAAEEDNETLKRRVKDLEKYELLCSQLRGVFASQR